MMTELQITFLKQGAADASLGCFPPDAFSLPGFYTRAFLEPGNLV